MIALAVGGLAAVVIGLVALLVVYAFIQLVKALSYAVPTLPIPGGGILRNTFRAIGTAAADAAAHYIKGMIHPLEKVIEYPAYLLTHWMQKVAAVFNDTAATLAWVTGHLIPAALSAARSYAWGLRQSIWAHISEDYYAIKAYSTALFHEAWAHISEDYYAVKAYSTALFERAWAHIAEDYYAVKAYSTALFERAWAHIAADYHALQSYAYRLYQDSRAYSAALFRAAEAAIVTAEARAVTTAEAYARTAVSAATGVITTDLVHPVEHVWRDVTDAAEGAISAAEGGLADVTAGLKSLTGVDVGDLAGVGALTGAIGLTLTRYLRECGIPNCRNLGKFGRDLQDLFKFAEDTALLALLAEMITDPAGTAADVEDVLGGIGRGVVTGARNLVGV